MNRFGIIRDQIVTQIKAAKNGDATNMFATPNSQVKRQGEFVSRGTLPIAIVELDEQIGDELEQTTKVSILIEWTVTVEFDLTSGSAALNGDLHAIHDDLFAGIYKSMMSTDDLRTLKTSVRNAIDTAYVRGGSKLTPGDAEESGGRWSFAVTFRTHYRHRVGDPGAQA